MSLGEECELYALVKQTLEKSGSMSQIRAQLRASVFLALEENGCFEKLKSKNNHLQELAKTSDGVLLLCLIREFLDFFGLSFTASVFEPELASYGIECDCKDYLKLGNALNLSPDYFNNKKGPLLCEILQIIRNFQKRTNYTTPEEPQFHNSKSTDSSTEYYQLQPVLSSEDGVNKAKQKHTESNYKDGFISGLKVSSSKSANYSVSSPSTLCKESDSSKHCQSSLGDLPPLTPQNSSTKNILNSNNNSWKHLHKVKAMLTDPLLSDNNDDFSVSSVNTDDEKENDKDVFDVSEIDEDIART